MCLDMGVQATMYSTYTLRLNIYINSGGLFKTKNVIFSSV